MVRVAIRMEQTVTLPAAGPQPLLAVGDHRRSSTRPELLLLLALTAGAVLFHGYHGGAEDAEIYLPGVLKHLNPACFQPTFFNSHANGKDSGAVSMFPALAGEWSAQVEARRGWKQFQRADFARLRARYRVDWVVLQQPGTRGLSCPYQNDRILVCRVD